MARSAANLRVVPATAPVDQRQPEDLLGYLFTREASLRADLADIEAEIGEQRARYAAKHSLGIRPRVEQLRAQFGPRHAGDAK